MSVMADIPVLKKNTNRRKLNIHVDPDVKHLYEVAKQNGYDSSEIARRAVSEKFRELEAELKRPASWASLFCRYQAVI